jgi:hypothetical protein
MGRDRWFATLSSTNTVNFAFPYNGEQHVSLLVRATATELKDVRFAIDKGQFACNGILETCYVQVRFDDGPIRRYAVNESSDHSTTLVFIRDIWSFTAALRKGEDGAHRSDFLSARERDLRIPHGRLRVVGAKTP